MAVSNDYDRMRMWQAADQPGHQLFLRCSVERGGRGSVGHGHAQFEAAFVLISVVEVKASCSEKVKCLNSNNLYPMTVIYNKLRIFVNAKCHSLKEIVAVLHDGSVVVLRILFSFHQ